MEIVTIEEDSKKLECQPPGFYLIKKYCNYSDFSSAEFIVYKGEKGERGGAVVINSLDTGFMRGEMINKLYDYTVIEKLDNPFTETKDVGEIKTQWLHEQPPGMYLCGQSCVPKDKFVAFKHENYNEAYGHSVVIEPRDRCFNIGQLIFNEHYKVIRKITNLKEVKDK